MKFVSLEKLTKRVNESLIRGFLDEGSIPSTSTTNGSQTAAIFL